VTEPTAVLIANFGQALQQINTYIAIGSAAAISAFVLDLQRPDTSAPFTVHNWFVPMTPGTAKLVLLGVCFVTGLMASYAAESATDIIRMLHSQPDLLKAACTYPSVATAPVGVRVGAAALPIAFVVPIVWRIWARIRKVAPDENVGGLIALIGVFGAPYATLGLILWRMSCRV
jgi:hypothetical protein